MVEELEKVLQGKGITIKRSEFFSAEHYIRPFIDRLASLNPTFKCLVKVPDQLSITDGEPDLMYSKVHIQAILPQTYYSNAEYVKVIGMIYGIDCKIPIVKFYIGDYNTVTGNTVIFNPRALIVQKLEPDTAINYSPIDTLLELTDTNKVMIEQLQNITVDRDSIVTMLGTWINYTLDNIYINDGGKVQLATSLPIDVYKSLVKNTDSEMYIPENESLTLFDIYNTFTYLINKDDKDIINRIEKILLVNRMLHL